MRNNWKVLISSKGQKPISNVEISISDDAIEELFDTAFDGWCPLCKNTEVNVGESICCSCLREAMAHHRNTCGCIKQKE